MASTNVSVNNGVNVEALLGAREALTEAPAAAKIAAPGGTSQNARAAFKTRSAAARSGSAVQDAADKSGTG